MKLSDLIEALAEEVDIMQPYLEQTLDELLAMDIDAPNFSEVLEQYNDYASRMGEAAEMVGFDGLKTICEQVQKNTLLLASISKDNQVERKPLVSFLYKWPKMMSMFLHELSDSSVAAGLVDMFLSAPVPFTDEQSLKVMHQLGTMSEQARDGENYIDPDNQRPTTATIEDVSLDLPSDISEQLLDGFLQESPDMTLEVVSWAQSLANLSAEELIEQDDIVTIKRYVHTLKGTGATIGLKGLASIGHHLEDILEFLEKYPSHLSPILKNAILDSAYCMEQMVNYVAGEDEYPQQSLSVLQHLLDIANRLDRGEPIDGLSPSNTSSSNRNSDLTSENDKLSSVQTDGSETQVPQSSASSNTSKSNKLQSKDSNKSANKASSLRVPISRIDDLFRVSGEFSVHTSAMESKIKSLTQHAKQLLEQNLKVQKRLLELETLVDVRGLSMMRGRMGNATNDSDIEFDSLEMDQYNELHSSAHALVEEASDSRVMAHKIEEALAQLASLQTKQQVLSRDLQHMVIGTRMAEVGVLESRLQRNVRMTSQSTGKWTNLVIQGNDTLIDSDVLNQLAEPLLHLLRNAVDHGIEMPEERERKGKDTHGNIYLTFSRQGQQVILRCEDDGQGLNLAKIRQRAIARQLISATQKLTDDEVSRLIFASGFSSQEVVSQISGRGVGLDVVREWVQGMKGTITIGKSQHGGCLFELRFAASLSTVHSLIVSVGKAVYALPATQIERAVPRFAGRFEQTKDELNFYYEDDIIPARYLASLTGMPLDQSRPLEEYDAVLVMIDNQRYALAVEQLMDSRELLVKAPDRYSRHMKGVSGLSILGNGDIVVNLDLTQIIHYNQGHTNQDNSFVTHAVVQELPKVLVVDDALTVRNSLQQLIEDMGYQVQTARDGLDAINVLNDFYPDIVLTDLEMPNLNGIELTQYIRNHESMNELPVVMITSRSQDKHRQLALNAGVSNYVTKPYQDYELIQIIGTYVY